MMKRQVVCCLLVVIANSIRAQESKCNAPDGGLGICKPIAECPSLVQNVLSIKAKSLYKAYIQDLVEDLIQRKDACKDNSTITRFCCSNCTTPNGKSGIITQVRKCDHLMNLLVSQSDLIYVKKSRIPSNNTGIEVCCGRAEDPATQASDASCDLLMGSPPDPSTKCCGVDAHADFRNVGSEYTGTLEYPWAVLIEYAKKTNLNCGGSLISSRHVVTAARCFHSSAGEPKRVRVGEYDRKNKGKDCISLADQSKECTDGAFLYFVESYLTHPGYDPVSAYNDIGLIRIMYPVRYSEFVRPICLPTFDASKQVGDGKLDFTVAGWGKWAWNSTRYKKSVQMKYIDLQICQDVYKYRIWSRNYNLWEKQICAGDESGKDSCMGAIGSGLMMEVKSEQPQVALAGVASFGAKRCGTAGLPAVYTHVYQYNQWILSNTRQHSVHWKYTTRYS